jgi:hypothetical protein
MCRDSYRQRDAALADLERWVESGQLKVREDGSTVWRACLRRSSVGSRARTSASGW